LSFANAAPLLKFSPFMLSFFFKRFSGRHYRKFLESCRPIIARVNELELS